MPAGPLHQQAEALAKDADYQRLASVIGPRFAKSVSVDEAGCWIWNAYSADNERGFYARIWWHGKTTVLSRLVLTILNGEIPPKMLVCHHCDKPACINPAHLFLGTMRENLLDCSRKGRNAMQKWPERSHFHSKRTHCKNGHLMSEHRIITRGGQSKCGLCHRERCRRNYLKRKAVA